MTHKELREMAEQAALEAYDCHGADKPPASLVAGFMADSIWNDDEHGERQDAVEKWIEVSDNAYFENVYNRIYDRLVAGKAIRLMYDPMNGLVEVRA